MLQKYRKNIDKIDSEIIGLLTKRKNLVEKIKKLKTGQNMPLEDKEREEQILKKAGSFKKVFIEIIKD